MPVDPPPPGDEEPQREARVNDRALVGGRRTDEAGERGHPGCPRRYTEVFEIQERQREKEQVRPLDREKECSEGDRRTLRVKATVLLNT